MERKRINSLVNEFTSTDADDSTFVCTRILGHKTEMPGSGQWKLIRDKSDDCWMCDQAIYGMVFWDNEKIAKRAYLSTQVPHQRDAMMKIMDKIWSIVPK